MPNCESSEVPVALEAEVGDVIDCLLEDAELIVEAGNIISPTDVSICGESSETDEPFEMGNSIADDRKSSMEEGRRSTNCISVDSGTDSLVNTTKIRAPVNLKCEFLDKDREASSTTDSLSKREATKSDINGSKGQNRYHPYKQTGQVKWRPTLLPVKELVKNRTRFCSKAAVRKNIPNLRRNLDTAVIDLPRFAKVKITNPPGLVVGAVDNVWLEDEKNKNLPRHISTQDYSFKLDRDYQEEYFWSDKEKITWNQQDVAGRWGQRQSVSSKDSNQKRCEAPIQNINPANPLMVYYDSESESETNVTRDDQLISFAYTRRHQKQLEYDYWLHAQWLHRSTQAYHHHNFCDSNDSYDSYTYSHQYTPQQAPLYSFNYNYPGYSPGHGYPRSHTAMAGSYHHYR